MIKDFSNFKNQLMSVNTVSQHGDDLEKNHLLGEKHIGIGQRIEQKTIVKSEVEKVKNIDEKIIELVLKSEITKVEPIAGFLIEIFSSGSDGRLIRLFKEDLVDLHGNILEEGFSRYLTLEIDK